MAAKLADELAIQIETAAKAVDRPGGTNYLVPPSVAKEIIVGMLFYAVAAANQDRW